VRRRATAVWRGSVAAVTRQSLRASVRVWERVNCTSARPISNA